MLKKKPKKPPQDLPDEIPPMCINSIYLGGTCDEPGIRNPVLKKLLEEFKKSGKRALKDFQGFVKERWPEAKKAYQERIKQESN